MRRAVLAFVLLLVAIPPSAAQNPKLDVTVTVPSEPLDEGEAGQVRFAMKRVCPNIAQGMPETELSVAFVAPDGIAFDGPGRVDLPQQTCALMPEQTVEATYQVTLSPSVAAGTALQVEFTVSDEGAGGPATPTAESSTGSFMLAKREAVPDNSTLDSQDASGASQPRDAPSFGVLLALAALAGTVWVRRRT